MGIILLFYTYFQSQFMQQTLENKISYHFLSRQKKRTPRMFLFKCTFTLNQAHCPFINVIFQGSNRSRQGRSGIMGKKSIFRRNRDKTPEPLQEYFSFFLKNLKYLFFNFIIIFSYSACILYFIILKKLFRNFCSAQWTSPPPLFSLPR